MAIGYYNHLTPEERLDKIGELLAKGVYFYYQNNTDEIKKSSEIKGKVSTPKTKSRKDINLVPKIDLNEKILTIKEAIVFLRISRTTLWRIRKRIKLPCYNLSDRLIRFKLSEILSFINSKSLLGNV